MIEESVREEIDRLSRIFIDRDKKREEADMKLEDFVNHYLDESGKRYDIKSLEEVIDVLPACVYRVKLRERIHGIKMDEKQLEGVQQKGEEQEEEQHHEGEQQLMQ